MIFDAHYHLEERLQPLDHLLADMAHNHVERVALIAPGCGPIKIGRLKMELCKGLPRWLLSPLPKGYGMRKYREIHTPDHHYNLLGQTTVIYDYPDNDSVAQALNRHPDKFYGWVFVNPKTVEPLAEIEKRAQQPGWIGVKALPYWHGYTLAQLDDVARWCAEKGWPMLIHLGPDASDGDFRYLPERHPHLKMIYAHAGVPFYRDVWAYARTKETVWVDLSNPGFVDHFALHATLKALGPGKCLYGSDGPYANAIQATMIPPILRLKFSDNEKEKILGGNFRELIHA